MFGYYFTVKYMLVTSFKWPVERFVTCLFWHRIYESIFNRILNDLLLVQYLVQICLYKIWYQVARDLNLMFLCMLKATLLQSLMANISTSILHSRIKHTKTPTLLLTVERFSESTSLHELFEHNKRGTFFLNPYHNAVSRLLEINTMFCKSPWYS